MITEYTPQIHHKRTEPVRNLVHTWLKIAGGWEPYEVRCISLVGEGVIEVETYDRDQAGKIKVIVRGGKKVASTSITRITLREPPAWWPQ